MEKQYAIETTYSFKGKFYITAESAQEAKNIVKDHCGAVLYDGIHSTIENVNWEFSIHPEQMKIGRIKRRF